MLAGGIGRFREREKRNKNSIVFGAAIVAQYKPMENLDGSPYAAIFRDKILEYVPQRW